MKPEIVSRAKEWLEARNAVIEASVYPLGNDDFMAKWTALANAEHELSAAIGGGNLPITLGDAVFSFCPGLIDGDHAEIANAVGSLAAVVAGVFAIAKTNCGDADFLALVDWFNEEVSDNLKDILEQHELDIAERPEGVQGEN